MDDGGWMMEEGGLGETEEGFEVIFLVEDIGGSAEEGEEEEDEADAGAAWAGSLDGYCGALEGGEGRGFFLDLGLGS